MNRGMNNGDQNCVLYLVAKMFMSAVSLDILLWAVWEMTHSWHRSQVAVSTTVSLVCKKIGFFQVKSKLIFLYKIPFKY